MTTQPTTSDFRDWEQVRAALVQAIAALEKGDALVVGEPTRMGAPTGFLRRAKPLPSRYVQFAADGEFVVAECVGSTAFGGEWEIRDDVDMGLVSRGWVHPEPGAFPNYRHDATQGDADRLARLAVESLRLLQAPLSDVEISCP